MEFEERVFEIVKKIPCGKVSTYGEIAHKLRSGARAVGNALKKSPGMPLVPCHRIVRSDGKVGGFALGTDKKIEILREEGIEVIDRRIDLEKYTSELYDEK